MFIIAFLNWRSMAFHINRWLLLLASTVPLAGCSLFAPKPALPPPAPARSSAPPAAATSDRGPLLSLEARALAGYLRGTLALAEGDQGVALAAFEQAAAADPRTPRIRRRLASLYVQNGMLMQALKHCEAAVRSTPGDLESRLLLADVLATLGRDEEAISHYERVLMLNPGHPKTRLLLGILYAKHEEFDKAIATLHPLTERESSAFLGHYYLGRIYTAANNSEGAEASYRSALRLTPRSAPVLGELALLYERQQRVDEAVKLYEQILQVNPERPMIRRRLAELYAGQDASDDGPDLPVEQVAADPIDTRTKIGLLLYDRGDYERAATEFGLVLAMQPDNHRVRFYLASINEQARAYDLAIEEFRRIPADNELFVDAQRTIASIHQEQGRITDASAGIEHARQLKPDDEELVNVQALLYREQGRFKQAIELMLQLIVAHPEDDRYHFTIGAFYDEDDRPGRCVHHMQRAVELNPENAAALNYLGYTYAEQGIQLDEAERLIRRALAVSPRDGYFIDSLGWVYYRQGHYDRAIEQLERAVTLATDDPTIAEHLGDAYDRVGRTNEALRIYNDALGQSTDLDQAARIRDKIGALQQASLHRGGL